MLLIRIDHDKTVFDRSLIYRGLNIIYHALSIFDYYHWLYTYAYNSLSNS